MNEFTCPRHSNKEIFRVTVLFLQVIFIVIFIDLLAKKPDLKPTLIYLAIFIPILGILQIPVGLMIRRIEKRKILISDQLICILYRDKQKSIQWNDINEVKIFETNKGEIYNITLRDKNHKGIGIRGFEKQREIVNMIEENIPEKTAVQISRDKLNWEFVVTRFPPIILFALIIINILIRL